MSEILLASRRPISLNNVLNQKIKPALKAAGLKWHGWHAFRRGVATSLHGLGVEGKVIQGQLRQANLKTTLDIYTHRSEHAAIAAAKTLENSIMFPNCALDDRTVVH